MDWLNLTSESQLEEINQKSFETQVKGILLFKHSTRCSISSMALSRLERKWKLANDIVPAYILNLLQHPSVSSKIAEQFSVRHESPQVLIIKNGKCIYNASHSDINAADIESALG
ncbi:MAG: bacillithiol system redox-active protein YtxJ [Bacteroidota bacterium]